MCFQRSKGAHIGKGRKSVANSKDGPNSKSLARGMRTPQRAATYGRTLAFAAAAIPRLGSGAACLATKWTEIPRKKPMSSEDGRHADAFYIKKECIAGRSCRRVWRAWFRAVFARFGASADEGEADAETEKNRDSVQKMGLSAAAIKTAVFTVQAASYMRLCAGRRAFQRCLRRRGSSKNADDRPSCRGSTPKVPKIGRRAADPSARALSRPSLSHYHRSIARQRSNTAVPAGSRSDQNCGLEKAHSPIGQIPRLCLRSPDGGENTAFFPKIRTPVPVA